MSNVVSDKVVKNLWYFQKDNIFRLCHKVADMNRSLAKTN